MPTKEQVLEILKPITDPEIPISIVDLGLIYDTEFNTDTKHLKVKMTLTAVNCPSAGSFVAQVKGRAEDMDEVDTCDVEIVYTPAWKPSMATLDGKIQLQSMGINVPLD